VKSQWKRGIRITYIYPMPLGQAVKLLAPR
jgi:hypothetical protein